MSNKLQSYSHRFHFWMLRVCSPVMMIIFFNSCGSNVRMPSEASINALELKKGNVISCGPPDAQFGTLDFDMSCDEATKKDFNLAVELLHSFEYDEAEKVFGKVIAQEPDCAMAYWGVAMSNFHPLWSPPSESELKKGARAIEIANKIAEKTERESDYINAIGLFYRDWNKYDHHTRCVAFENAMEQIHKKYPSDNEAAIFYGLSLDASALPTDKTYKNQQKAGEILNALYLKEPNHPGIIHYVIHTYDYPGLAQQALPAARRYAEVAPSSAHALHMPSHIFTRLGLWDEDIASNVHCVSAAKCYAEQANIEGHWDEELHGLDYLVYAYLQKGDNTLALEQVKYLDTIKSVYPVNFKIAYSFAAIPARYVLENKLWKEAATLPLPSANFSWMNFPWQEAIIHFTRLLGAAHAGEYEMAGKELAVLQHLKDVLDEQRDSYKSKEVAIQVKAGEAWISFQKGDRTHGIGQMKLAANMEDSVDKHPVTPGEVLPARELLGDMLLKAGQYGEALKAYEAVLAKSPNRFNALYNAGYAAEKLRDTQKAKGFFTQLLTIADTTKNERPEIELAKGYLNGE